MTRYAPRNPYSASKASAGGPSVNAYLTSYRLPLTISNCSNNYGKRQHKEKLIPKAILSAVQNQKIPVYGNGMQIGTGYTSMTTAPPAELILEKGAFGETLPCFL